MKKIFMLFSLLTLVIFSCGCSIKNIDENTIDKLIDETINYEARKANNYYQGYKFYIPRGYTQVNRKGSNHVLMSNGDYYYLYVDTISYFNKEKNETTFDNNLYFSKKISYNDIDGYIKIDKLEDGMYYFEIMYNYSKVEALVSEENLENGIKNSIIILTSLTYNDIILDTLIGDKTLDYKEEPYNFFESKRTDGNFLDYIEEYDIYNEENNVKDEDVIVSNDE
ncbi:MAG: hypothetical protein IJ568_06095 [Bacilli bacterium]|nr:hypothetical protein [Bacilli bacterium]